MSWAVVRGVYKEGIIEPLEKVADREGTEVLVLFPKRAAPAGARGIWQQIKQDIAGEAPDLLKMTNKERREEFDRLSDMIVERMPYRSVEEFEKAMRGDEYGLVGY